MSFILTIFSCVESISESEKKYKEIESEIDSIKQTTKSYIVKNINNHTKRTLAMSHYINTTVSEYLPVLDEKNDILYFTAMDRKGYFDFKLDHTKSISSGGEDLFFSEYKNNIFIDSRPLNYLNTNRHESISHVTDEGNLVITGNYDETMGPNYRKSGFCTTDIFIAKKEANSFRILHFDEPVNSMFTEADAIFEEDEYVLFVSDRPNGVGEYKKKGWSFNESTWGNTDIYISFKNGDYWSNPLNLGDRINTDGAERTPWLSDDKKTIFLSSNGYENKNDLDVYYFVRENVDDWTNWNGPFKLEHICTNQDDWGYKTYKNKSFVSRARVLPFKTSQVAREGDGGVRETNYRPNYEVFGLQTASLKKTQQTDIYEIKNISSPDITFEDVLFKKNQFEINSNFKEQLEYLIDLIKVNSKSEILVVGHTDNDGDELYNKELSIKRAASVKNYLISRKIKNNIIATGKGEKKPIVENSSEANKRKNRRVEIFINSE